MGRAPLLPVPGEEEWPAEEDGDWLDGEYELWPRGLGACAVSYELRVNPIACTGHGMCAELLPEMIELDPWGYPILVSTAVPRGL